MNPFDFLNSINFNKKNLLENTLPEDEKKYLPFMVNRGLSYFPDTVAVANEMNRYHHLDNKLQYDFLRSIVRKRKRFSKWNKVEQQDKIALIMECYGYTRPKAESVADLLSGEQIETIKRRLSKGGKTKNYK